MFNYEKKVTTIKSNTLEALILETGNIKEITAGINRINSLASGNLCPGLVNIYLLVEDKYEGLIGVGSHSTFDTNSNQVIYEGVALGISYRVIFTLIDNAYFFDVILDNNENKNVKLFYGMDVGLADKFAILNNEAYVAQYVDHKVFKINDSYIVASRQNQGRHIYLEEGSLNPLVGYSTDGYQFFKKSYKLDNKIGALENGKLDNEIYQYEFAYTALESPSMNDSNIHYTFYGIYKEDVDKALDNAILRADVDTLYKRVKLGIENKNKNSLELKMNFNNILISEDFVNEDLNNIYSNRTHEEYIDNKLASFFQYDYSHVVLKNKEAVLERPSGQILISGNYLSLANVLSNTSYIYGLFTSQICSGNTSFNKLSSNQRNSLNLDKTSGMRMLVKIDNEYKLLATPSLFQMGLGYIRWIYKINNDSIFVEVGISSKEGKLVVHFKSLNNIKYDVIVTNYITMGQNEGESPIAYELIDNGIKFTPAEGTMAYNHYGKLYFKQVADKNVIINDDRVFYMDNESHGDNILTMSLSESEFNITIVGDSLGNEIDTNPFKLIDESREYINGFKSLLNGFELRLDGKEHENIDAFNYLAYWYTQNALVHFASPHGLEQYNGAAWGTRDVCQGPSEYFMATGHYDIVRGIILEVYKHQYLENGNWPQWFMFDRYYRIQQNDSHGDIIVWPMRLLGLYLEATNDYSILDEVVEYTNISSCDYTKEKYKVADHLENEINNIIKSFINDTSLSCYGGGDWDDTLQPAHKEYASHMVSGWTVALTYEALVILSRNLKGYSNELSEKYLKLSVSIKSDYNKYIMDNNIPAGFIHFKNNEITKIIHPNDHETGMKYRLLPFNRGIISELFTTEQKNIALDVINHNLKHVDGVRLMDKAVNYNGGDNTYFQRAETAANFGREIGLQYCHAHIRYCEAMGKCGEAYDLYRGLLTIMPIRMKSIVANALPRQRNSYFSSSDGDFLNRYDAIKNFNKLYNGEVGVKAGWRIYSSGPGIYLNQLIGTMLGIRLHGDYFTLDPVLPKELNGLELNYKIDNKMVHVRYINDNERRVIINRENVEYEEIELRYRRGGYLIKRDVLKDKNEIEVHF